MSGTTQEKRSILANDDEDAVSSGDEGHEKKSGWDFITKKNSSRFCPATSCDLSLTLTFCHQPFAPSSSSQRFKPLMWYIHMIGMASYFAWIGVGASNMSGLCEDTQMPVLLVGYGIFSLISLTIVFSLIRTLDTKHKKADVFAALGFVSFLVITIVQFGVLVAGTVWFIDSAEDACQTWFMAFGKTVTICEYFMLVYRMFYCGFHFCHVENELLVNKI